MTAPRQLSPRDAARALGASESSLKRWVDAGELVASRSAGGHRRIPFDEVVRFASARGLRLRLHQQPAPPELAPAVEQALLAGDLDRLRRLLLQALVDGVPVHALGDGPLRAAMAAVGERWRHSPLGIAEEHRATLLVLRALEAVRIALPTPADDAPRAVGGAPAGDPYQLPSALAALVLQQAGWQVADLGADTPDQALAAAVRSQGARLAWRSLAGEPAADTAAGLRTLAAAIAPCALAVGGRRLAEAGAVDAIPGLHPCATLADLDRVARSLLED